MINAERNSFIKQYIELYGRELFLDSLNKKSKKSFHNSSKNDLLESLYHKIYIGLNPNKKNEENKLVFGSGDPNANLLIIGESPRNYEIEGNKPFLGNSGKLLDKILKAIGFTRSEKVYLTYLIKYKIDNNRDPLKSEINKFIPFIKKQIKIIEPKIIVGLGKVVGKALIEKNLPLENMRNKVHSFCSFPLKITYSPETLLREHSLKKFAWEDFQLIRDFVN